MSDGFAVSVPYHDARQGWLFKHRVDYRGTFSTVPLSEFEHFTAEDRVKLSMHLEGGFVQFSKGGTQPVLSGRDQVTGAVKGLGLLSNSPIEITTGPTFGVQVSKLDEFELLGNRLAEIFEHDDFYVHPRMTHPDSTAYHVEGFVFPREWLKSARNVKGRLILTRELPFISMFHFPFQIRVIEFPKLNRFVGLLVHRMDNFGQGYRLNGPSHGPPGSQMVIGAAYPRPDFAKELHDSKSLDYPPLSDKHDLKTTTQNQG